MSETSRSNVARENALGLATAHWIADLAAAGFQHSRAPSEAVARVTEQGGPRLAAFVETHTPALSGLPDE